MPAAAIKICTTLEELIDTLLNTLSAHDTVLIKGSQSMRFEKVVAAILADPSSAGSVLARQYGNWTSL